eukprot:GHVU01008121.1.p1 GENE.GHVU01008121.1~~GHVU01008121.1.p1  ORF type:complete len:284 (+),score=62.58 GHVU01008121.1:260-1111(+)
MENKDKKGGWKSSITLTEFNGTPRNPDLADTWLRSARLFVKVKMTGEQDEMILEVLSGKLQKKAFDWFSQKTMAGKIKTFIDFASEFRAKFIDPREEDWVAIKEIYQKKSEKLEDYYDRLIEMSRHLKTEDANTEDIRLEAWIEGIMNEQVKTKTQQANPKTLEEALTAATNAWKRYLQTLNVEAQIAIGRGDDVIVLNQSGENKGATQAEKRSTGWNTDYRGRGRGKWPYQPEVYYGNYRGRERSGGYRGRSEREFPSLRGGQSYYDTGEEGGYNYGEARNQ